MNAAWRTLACHRSRVLTKLANEPATVRKSTRRTSLLASRVTKWLPSRFTQGARTPSTANLSVELDDDSRWLARNESLEISLFALDKVNEDSDRAYLEDERLMA